MDKISIDQYKVSYTLIDNGDGIIRCGWCKKATKAIKQTEDLDKHLEKHEEEENG